MLSHILDDLSCVPLCKLRRNRSEEKPKIKVYISYQSTVKRPCTPRSTSPGPAPPTKPPVRGTCRPFNSAPSSPVPFRKILLGDWCRTKRLEEILSLFPSTMTLQEFSLLDSSLSPDQTSPTNFHQTHHTDMIVKISGCCPSSQVVVTDPRLREKVVVAIHAARAARLQAERAEQLVTPGGSPVHITGQSLGNRRSLDVEALSLFHSPRLTSPRPTTTRSLSTLYQMSCEDIRRSKQDTLGQAISSGNIQSLGR